MTTQRRSYETGHQPKCLVIVDDSAEWDRAVYYASRWAIRVGGGVVMLRVIETEDQNQQWLGVADIMRAEAHEAANEALDRASGRAVLREAPTLLRSDDLAAQLPYLLVISRLAHYLQRVQRERVGRWDDRAALQRELELWLRQLVADIDDPPPEVRARKPLRSASLTLSPLPNQPGWHRCHLKVVPHLTHLGRPLTLELVGRLDIGHH